MKANELFFPRSIVVFIAPYKVVLPLCLSWDKTVLHSCIVDRKDTDQYFAVVLLLSVFYRKRFEK